MHTGVSFEAQMLLLLRNVDCVDCDRHLWKYAVLLLRNN